MINDAGLKLITYFEGERLKAYKCAADVWTIGIGLTRYPDGSLVKEGDIITKEKSREYFKEMLINFVSDTLRLTEYFLNENQLAACVSLAYNLGINGFSRSLVFQYIKEKEYGKAANAFLRYNRARTKEGELVVLKGLIRRRKAERELFLKPVQEEFLPIRPIPLFKTKSLQQKLDALDIGTPVIDLAEYTIVG